MAKRSIVFHFSNGTSSTYLLGYDFTVTAAIRKYFTDDLIAKMNLVTDVTKRRILGESGIGGELVENHLKSIMKIFIEDGDFGTSIEFI